MSMRAQDAYLVEKILSADPVELVQVLYRSALDAVERARRALGAKDIPGRSAAISKAIEVLTELSMSLNREAAPELSHRLAELYDYLQRRLVAANFEQADAPLAEVARLLETLAQAWQGISVTAKPSRASAPCVSAAWNPSRAESPALQGWSF